MFKVSALLIYSMQSNVFEQILLQQSTHIERSRLSRSQKFTS